MTRVLSELLGAREPAFRLGLKQLERAGGNPNEDIRLSAEIQRQTKASLVELGLDPHDTTGPELFSALSERSKQDESTVRDMLGFTAGDINLASKAQRFLDRHYGQTKVFAIKNSSAKRLIKKNPPKKAMKQLGYRSLDSMLKHESPVLVLCAATIAEAAAWHRQLIAAYKSLKPSDFETRNIALVAPTGKNWEKLAASYVTSAKNNVLAFKELGATVLLPIADPPDGAALACVLLGLHAINNIRFTSTYCKLHQVRPDFGSLVSLAAHGEPYTDAVLLDKPLPWQLIHRYFARSGGKFNAELFEPHVQPEDLHWEPAEHMLAKLHESFKFWQRNAYLGMLEQNKPVSINLTDAVLNFCNKLPYERRVVHYFRDHLWHELMLRYLRQENPERVLHEQLGNELVRPLIGSQALK